MKAGKFILFFILNHFNLIHDIAPFYQNIRPLVNELIMLSTYINYIGYFSDKSYKFNKFDIVKNRLIRKLSFCIYIII